VGVTQECQPVLRDAPHLDWAQGHRIGQLRAHLERWHLIVAFKTTSYIFDLPKRFRIAGTRRNGPIPHTSADTPRGCVSR